MITSSMRAAGQTAGVSRFLGTVAGTGIKAGLLATSLALLGAAGSVHAEGDPAAGAGKVETCLGCHGVKHYINTYPSYHVPRIAGQNADYIIVALQAYRAKTRAHETMQANAALLSDQDIEDIAAWFSLQGVSN